MRIILGHAHGRPEQNPELFLDGHLHSVYNQYYHDKSLDKDSGAFLFLCALQG